MHSHDSHTPTEEHRALIITPNAATVLSLQRMLQQAKWQVEVYQDPSELYSTVDTLPWALVILVCDGD